MSGNYIGIQVVTAWPREHAGESGYAVREPDGSHAWSPSMAFEAAYRACGGDEQALGFGEALHLLRLGEKLTRRAWLDAGLMLECCQPRNPRDLPYLRLTHMDGREPWLPAQSDLFAEDWMVLP